MEVNAKLISITRIITAPDRTCNEKETVIHHKGDPGFDKYISSGNTETSSKIALPKNFLGPTSIGTTCDGTKLSLQLTNIFEQYYCGQVDTTAIENTMSCIVVDLRSSYVSMGFDPSEFMPQLIEDVYNVARLGNIRGAGVASWYDSLPLAQEQNGHDRNTRDWIYYDSKYYYNSETMKGKLLQIAQSLGEAYGVSNLNLPVTYDNEDIRKGIYSSYNTYINERARNDCHVGNMLNESLVPPVGFKFFYKANGNGDNRYMSYLPPIINEPEAAFDSFLSIWYEDWSFAGRVPVRMDATRFPASVNMYDVVCKSSSHNIPNEIKSFLKNFDFFSTIQGKRYTDLHPRKY